MTRATLFAIVAVIIGTVAIFGYYRIPDDVGMTWQEQEAAANSPRVVTDADTPLNETRPPEPLQEDAVVDLNVTSDVEQEVPANYDFFTVEGYDPLRAREYLVDTNMPVAKREDYLSQLSNAHGDKDALGAVLKELREELQLG